MVVLLIALGPRLRYPPRRPANGRSAAAPPPRAASTVSCAIRAAL